METWQLGISSWLNHVVRNPWSIRAVCWDYNYLVNSYIKRFVNFEEGKPKLPWRILGALIYTCRLFISEHVKFSYSVHLANLADFVPSIIATGFLVATYSMPIGLNKWFCIALSLKMTCCDAYSQLPCLCAPMFLIATCFSSARCLALRSNWQLEENYMYPQMLFKQE